MKFIIGLDDFGEVMQNHLNFIDKSLFIKEVLDNNTTQVSVITRPRRFGKTLNMSMLHHFLAKEVNGLVTKGMFDLLKIAQTGSEYMEHQGQYPVIFMSFKGIKDSKFSEAYEKLSILMAEAYREHRYLSTSEKLYPDDKKAYEKILNQEVTSKATLENSLKELTRFLYLHHGVKPWLLIDEYDTPIQSGYLHNYYQEIIDLMRGLFGNALKGNPNLHRAVITGILRIAKENLFSGLNNIEVFSLLSTGYAEHFGFTQEEIDQALKKFDLPHLSEVIKTWYNGYHIGQYQIYNPWSIANCLNKEGLMQPYWVNTSDNALIKQSMARATVGIKEKFELLLANQPIDAMIDESMVFPDLANSGDALWSLLLFSGYLTAIRTELVGMKNKCTLIPPNREVALLYPDIIARWFTDQMGEEKYQLLLTSLTEGHLKDFLQILQKFLAESASYFDVKGNEPEKFYHGFVMGLMVSLSDTHLVQSNKESGLGRYDVMLIPKDKQKLGLILEFKVAEKNISLQETAKLALAQINQRQYTTELRQKGIKKVLKIGLAFYEKEVALEWED